MLVHALPTRGFLPLIARGPSVTGFALEDLIWVNGTGLLSLMTDTYATFPSVTLGPPRLR